MNDNAAFVDKLMERCGSVVSGLKADEVIGKYIDTSLPLPRPFVGTGPIRLVIVGQDPTVEKLESRKRVTTVLTLNQKGSNLHRFVERICTGLDVSLDQNVYATNICKNFFTDLPESVTPPDLIGLSCQKWRDLLSDELARFPKATVITLGKPVLRVLVQEPSLQDLKHYWGHVEGWKTKGHGKFHFVEGRNSSFGKRFFPFPHITNTQTTELYRKHFDEYLRFARSNIMKEAM
jgi:uracil-DNA glycosylase